MVIPQGVNQVRRVLPDILEASERPLSDFLRPRIAQLYEQLREYDARIQGYDRQLDAVCEQEAACQRLLAVEGIGPVVATALVGAFGDGKPFSSARQLSAALGTGTGAIRNGREGSIAGPQQTGRSVPTHTLGPWRPRGGECGPPVRQNGCAQSRGTADRPGTGLQPRRGGLGQQECADCMGLA